MLQQTLNTKWLLSIWNEAWKNECFLFFFTKYQTTKFIIYADAEYAKFDNFKMTFPKLLADKNSHGLELRLHYHKRGWEENYIMKLKMYENRE